MCSAGPENDSESRPNGGVCVPGMCRFGVCDELVSVPFPGSRSRPSFSGGSMRFFSELGLQISVSRHRIVSGNVSSSVQGFLPQRVKNESIVSMESVEPSESSIDVSSICETVSVSSTSYCLSNWDQRRCRRASYGWYFALRNFVKHRPHPRLWHYNAYRNVIIGLCFASQGISLVVARGSLNS
jgi:hypothetical protein